MEVMTIEFKVTYHLGSEKRNFIVEVIKSSQPFDRLNLVIKSLLFKKLGYPEKEIRLYWIDNENDEIDILSNSDYYSLLKYHPQSKNVYHVHVANIDSQTNETSKSESAVEHMPMNSAPKQQKVSPADDSYENAVHDHVECDSCLMAPIVGFRYKCIQCPNYDLCQNCESKHVHSEHMMVRMPNNHCPSVVETYITGRTSGRKHGKRSKTSCPFVKNGLSVILDDNVGESSNAGGGDKSNEQQSSPSNGKERHHGRRHHRRHHRNNFLAHLYEMMRDLAEGGCASAPAHAIGNEESSSSTKTTAATKSGPHTATTNNRNLERNQPDTNIIAAQIAAQQAHESAVQAAEIASKVAHETAEIASKVAHETAAQAAKNISANLFTAQTVDNNGNEIATENDKVDAKTSPPDNLNTMPEFLPPLETFAQLLDPQYMQTGIQILNNFSNMFSKMLDPIYTGENVSNNKSSTSYPLNINSRKNSVISTKLNDTNGGDEKELEKEKCIEKQLNTDDSNNEGEQLESDISSNVDIEDIGSDSESDSFSESFIKLDAPKEDDNNKSTIADSSTQNNPQQSSNVMDFAQLSANLKTHIAEETARTVDSSSIDTGVVATEQVTNNTNTSAGIIVNDPMVTTNSATTAANEEKRAVIVYHADERIDKSVHAMMAMGFSNEGAWLTRLLESVDGSIPEALDLMSVAQRGGGR